MRFTANNNNYKSTRRNRKKKYNSQGSPVSSQQLLSGSRGKSNIFDHSDPSIRSFSIFTPPGRENSYETTSCPIIDDRSNSASPTRRQPHPAGMNTFRGFGQTPGHAERILEWPPPEPRPIFIRPIVPQFGVMLGGLPRLPQNQDVWFFGPTANIHQLIFESVPDVIEVDDGNPSEETSPQLLREGGSGFHGTASDSTINTDIRTLEAVGGESREAGLRVDNEGGITRSLVASPGEPLASEAQIPAESGQSIEEAYAELAPGFSVTPSNDEVYNAILVQQTNSEPPPRPIFFVIVDTNEGGPADDEQQAAQFQFALMQLLAQLESTSDEEPPFER